MNTKRQTIACWFEIPVADMNRACAFYEKLLGVSLTREEKGESRSADFPHMSPGISGALVQRPNSKPGAGGSMVYLNADGQMDAVIARVATLGGLVIVPKTALPEGMGHFACFLDCEGNSVGLHAVV